MIRISTKFVPLEFKDGPALKRNVDQSLSWFNSIKFDTKQKVIICRQKLWAAAREFETRVFGESPCMGEIKLSQVLETARPITDWSYTEDGIRYRWVELDRETIAALRELLRHRSENTELCVCMPHK